MSAADKQNRAELRSQIERVLHIPKPLWKPREKDYGQFSPASGVAADRVVYSTDYQLRVPAIVYHAAGATISQHPAIIVVSGYREDKSSPYAYWAGILYARAGAIVLTYDSIGEYERNSERQSGVECVPSRELLQRFDGLMVTDVLQGVSYLLTRKDVDAKRIAVMSDAAASFVASMACAEDARIHACVVSGRDTSQIPGHDQDWFESLRRQTMDAFATSKNVLERTSTADSETGADFLTKPVALWLEQQLHFPTWTKKDIEALPETNLGKDIPAVPRADLHAIPEAVWDFERDDFIYETWVDRAKSAITSGAP